MNKYFQNPERVEKVSKSKTEKKFQKIDMPQKFQKIVAIMTK